LTKHGRPQPNRNSALEVMDCFPSGTYYKRLRKWSKNGIDDDFLTPGTALIALDKMTSTVEGGFYGRTSRTRGRERHE
jgi:hypothetical protein